MPRDAFPVDADVVAFFVAQWPNLNSGALTLLTTGSAEAALDAFQTDTRQQPFLKDASDVTRYFDPPGPESRLENQFYRGGGKLLQLEAGLLSCTSISLGVNADNPNGDAMDLQRQLRLMPQNAAARGKPYTWIEFFFPVYGSPGSLKIVGKWGYSAQVPEDAWQAVLKKAAAMSTPAVIQALSDGLAAWSEGDASEKYSPIDLETSATRWDNEVDACILRYSSFNW